ncbi:MAG: YihY/virulence factor BrkB family protein [Lachnospiraceae bacterium]|nr:YihY/virulence factor BrkB family protein [Lachnospiraceae bacterium]
MDNIFIWFITKFNKHRVTIHAAQVAFFVIVSLFPFMMFLITLLRYTPISGEVIDSVVESAIPGNLSDVVMQWLNESYAAASGTILSVTVITTLWAGSKGFSSIAFELDCIYEVQGRRGLIIRRLLSLLDTVAFTVMIIASLIVLVYGNQIVQMINQSFPLLSNLRLIIFILRSSVAFLAFVIYFLFMYRYIPNRKSSFRNELPGAVFSAFLWIVFSYLYSLYIDYHSSFSSVYGSLTYMVLLMLWIYFCVIIIFLGAMLNQYLRQHSRLHLLSSLKEIRGIVRSYLENKM